MFSAPLDPDHPYFSLPSQYQRDLIWSVLGPALLDCDWSPVRPAFLQHGPTLPWQHWLDAQQPPLQFRSPRLGLMFEQLWHQYFRLCDMQWLANVQIQDDKRTLGELDLLIRPETGHGAYHLELALKFYLGIGDDWIGPNRRDYLADKIRHTRDKQLPLANHLITQQTLQQHGWPLLRSSSPQSPQQPQLQPQPQSQALMRGCLFHPADPAINATLPKEVNPQHWSGEWIHHQQSDQLLPDSRWFLLSKPQWISPACVDFSVDKATLLRHCNAHFHYLDTALCAVEVQKNDQGRWCEQRRWLIMPDHWPRSAER